MSHKAGSKAKRAESGATVRRRSGYSAIPNSVIRNTEISPEARLMLCYIMSCAEDWVFYQSVSQKVLGCGKDKYQRIIRELKDAGYLIAHTKHGASGKLEGWEWEIIDDPEAHAAKQDVEGTSEEPPQTVEAAKDNRLPENPADGEGCCKNDRKPGFTDRRFLPTDGFSGHIRNTNLQKEKLTSCAADAPHADFDFSAFLVRFKSIYPRLGDPEKTEVALGAALEAGADPDHILAAARAYADEQSGQEARFISYSENWLAQERWKRHPAPGTAPGNPELITQQRAKAIRDGQRWVSACVSPTAARAMVATGLVTEAQCHAVGVQL